MPRASSDVTDSGAGGRRSVRRRADESVRRPADESVRRPADDAGDTVAGPLSTPGPRRRTGPRREPEPVPRRLRRPRWPGTAAVLGALVVGAVLAGAVVLRFLSPPDLWLDEAQSVAIAQLPVEQMWQALREDGSPPLYYLLLHAWISAFGESSAAVRALSGVAATASLAVAGLAAWLLGGRRAAVPAVVLLATSPFAVRYATETRPYALAALLVLLGVVAAERLARTRSAVATLGLGLVLGALALTHYWTAPVLLVVGTGALGLLATRHRGVGVRLLVACAVGAATVVPWLPSLREQLATTGTPWSGPPTLAQLANAVSYWSGSGAPATGFLTYALVGLAALGLVALPRRPRGVPGLPAPQGGLAVVQPRGSAVGWALLAASLGALALGLLAAELVQSAYVARYSAPELPLFLLLAALGVAVLPSAAGRAAVLVVTGALGLSAAVPLVDAPRTNAGAVADVLVEQRRPGDLVVACPDQLGPAVARLAPEADVRAYPGLAPADRVDWTDYEERQDAADGERDARRLLARAGSGTVWVVLAEGYATYDGLCTDLVQALQLRRPGVEEVGLSPPPAGLARLSYESPRLLRYAPPGRGPAAGTG